MKRVCDHHGDGSEDTHTVHMLTATFTSRDLHSLNVTQLSHSFTAEAALSSFIFSIVLSALRSRLASPPICHVTLCLSVSAITATLLWEQNGSQPAAAGMTGCNSKSLCGRGGSLV